MGIKVFGGFKILDSEIVLVEKFGKYLFSMVVPWPHSSLLSSHQCFTTDNLFDVKQWMEDSNAVNLSGHISQHQSKVGCWVQKEIKLQ